MVYRVPLNRKQLEKEFSKLRKLKYNQFRWWRMYDDPKEKLSPKASLRDRIINGDFDFSHYKYQVMWCEHEINDVWEECKPDIAKFNEKTSLLRTRRKRLLDDFEKDETEKLQTLITEFTQRFKCNKEQVLDEMENCIDSLLDLYYTIEKKYKIIFTPPPLKRRGRPSKLNY
jgi:hypothetical protein